MEHVLFFVILFVWCAILAWLEVEIEGKDGWAKNAPTWKYKLDGQGTLLYKHFGVQGYWAPICSKRWQNFFVWYIKNMLGGREFTGYHRAVDVMQLFVGHLVVYLMCGPISVNARWWVIALEAIVLELRVIATIQICWALEDTLWFRLNPFYKDGKRTPEWHKDWNAKHRASKGMLGLFRNGCLLYVATCIAMFFLRR